MGNSYKEQTYVPYTNELKFDVRYGVIFMAKLTLKTLKINNNSNNVATHIFINKLVEYDYDNYKRFFEKKYTEYFSKTL